MRDTDTSGPALADFEKARIDVARIEAFRATDDGRSTTVTIAGAKEFWLHLPYSRFCEIYDDALLAREETGDE